MNSDEIHRVSRIIRITLLGMTHLSFVSMERLGVGLEIRGSDSVDSTTTTYYAPPRQYISSEDISSHIYLYRLAILYQRSVYLHPTVNLMSATDQYLLGQSNKLTYKSS